jgi:hypothetical protein
LASSEFEITARAIPTEKIPKEIAKIETFVGNFIFSDSYVCFLGLFSKLLYNKGI